jgi:hypothetical protein
MADIEKLVFDEEIKDNLKEEIKKDFSKFQLKTMHKGEITVSQKQKEIRICCHEMDCFEYPLGSTNQKIKKTNIVGMPDITFKYNNKDYLIKTIF